MSQCDKEKKQIIGRNDDIAPDILNLIVQIFALFLMPINIKRRRSTMFYVSAFNYYTAIAFQVSVK